MRFSGVYRDVFLPFDDPVLVRDLGFSGAPSSDLQSVDAAYRVELANKTAKQAAGLSLDFELLPLGSDMPVKRWSEAVEAIPANSGVTVKGAVDFRGLDLWSPDLPNLYTLLVTLKDARRIPDKSRSDAVTVQSTAAVRAMN